MLEMFVLWLALVMAVAFATEEEEFLDSLSQKRADNNPSIPHSHGHGPGGKIDCRGLGGDLAKLTAQGERIQELYGREYYFPILILFI